MRRKTGQVLKVELLPVMLKIIRKYHQPGQPYLFPVLKNADASWKEYDSALRLQNKRLNILGNQIGTRYFSVIARFSVLSIFVLMFLKGEGRCSMTCSLTAKFHTALERNLAEMEEIVQHLKDTKECSAERIVHDFRNRKCYTLWLEYIQLVML